MSAQIQCLLIWWDPFFPTAPLGFYLAKQLQSAGHSVTIMTGACILPLSCTLSSARGCFATATLTFVFALPPACAADSDKLKKPPYAYWGELTSAGCSAVFGEAVSPSLFPAGATFDVVVDNNGAAERMNHAPLCFAADTHTHTHTTPRQGHGCCGPRH